MAASDPPEGDPTSTSETTSLYEAPVEAVDDREHGAGIRCGDEPPIVECNGAPASRSHLAISIPAVQETTLAMDKCGLGSYDLYRPFGHEESDPTTPTDAKDVTVSHKMLHDFIVNEKITVNIAFILLMVCGLPDCGKTELLMNLLRRVVTKQPKTPVKRVREHDKDAVMEYYELAAVGPNRTNCHVHYTETTKDTCIRYSFESALKYHYFSQGQRISQFHDPQAENPESQFKDEDLNRHFFKVFECLRDNHNERPSSITYPPTPEKKSPTHKKKTLCDWEKSIPSGIAMINIWDLKGSKSGYNFLPALCGHLHSGLVWSFLDLERDVPNLHRTLRMSERATDEDRVWWWQARIRPYLRLAMLASSKDPNIPRSKVCSLFATYGCNLATDEEKRKRLANNLSEEVKGIAPQLGIEKLTDIENVRVIQKIGECRVRAKESDMVLQEMCNKKIIEVLKSPHKVPLSCLFLRTSYYKKDPLYVTKAELRAKAEELGMSDEVFQNDMCVLHTSVGTLIDVSLIDATSPYVIMNPVKFLHELDKIFSCNEKYHMITDHGLITEADAELIYGEDKSFFMEVLISVGTAVKLETRRVLVNGRKPDGEYCYIVPGARTGKPLTGCIPSALHLMRSIDAPLRNILLDFTRSFMNIVTDAMLVFTEKSQANVNNFKTIVKDLPSSESIEFSVVRPVDALEFRLPVDKVSEELCCSIVQSCHDLMEQTPDFRYNLCIVCSTNSGQTSLEDPQALPAPRHILSKNTLECEDCLKCGEHLLQTLTSVIKKNPVPEEKLMNGEKLTFENVVMIAKQLQHVHQDALNTLVDKLGLKHIDRKLTGWRLILAIIMEWESVQAETTTSCEAGSKKQFARILYNALPEENEAAGLFMKVARAIDMTVVPVIRRHLNSSSSCDTCE